MNAKDTLTQIIQQRQSVYPAYYSGEIIPKDTIDWILQNAIQAPSHRKINPWRFRVISGDNRKGLARFFEDTYKAHVAEDKFNERKYNSFATKLDNTSHVLIISMQEDPEKPLPQWENVAAVAAAVQNIYLSVHAAGYGGYWSSPALMIKHIENLITLNANETCLGFFYLGVPKGPLPEVMPKGDMEDFVEWV